MIIYCCKHVGKNKTTYRNYVRTEKELLNVCRAVRRQGFTPQKSIITVSDDGVRKEVRIR